MTLPVPFADCCHGKKTIATMTMTSSDKSTLAVRRAIREDCTNFSGG